MNLLSGLFAVIGYIVVGAGAVGTFAWWIFRTFSEKWLNARFEERLASYKHEQQKELEHLKFAINAQMDRATKLHQKEFEALPGGVGSLDAGSRCHSERCLKVPINARSKCNEPGTTRGCYCKQQIGRMAAATC